MLLLCVVLLSDSKLEMETTVIVNEGILRILPIPGDGDCLFSALSHQIWGSFPGSPELDVHVRTLRALTVRYYEERLLEWTDQLYAQAVVIFPELTNHMTVVQLVHHYLQCLRQAGFWGGEESIVAIASSFGYQVKVFRENSSSIIINPEGATGLQIVHRMSADGEYRHYDSVLGVRPGLFTFASLLSL